MKNKLFLATLAATMAIPAVIAPIQVDAQTVSFKDVTEKSYAFDAISYLASEGIIAGYGNGYFGLKDNVTRGQVSALIVRYLKLDTSKDFENPYTDVKGTAFEDSILAVTNAGYMSGKGKNEFEPKATLTRAEMAVVLTNVFDLKVKSPDEFHDMNAKHWANNAVKALYSNGITFGSGDYKYNPSQNVTREQYAEFLYRGINVDADFKAEPIPQKPTEGEKPSYTNSQGEMTRAGLARFIVETIAPNVSPSKDSFSDIDKGSYTEDYVQKAIALGFINPKEYSNGFGVNTKVNRSEVSTWIVNAMAKNNEEYAKVIQEFQSDWTLLPVIEFLKGDIAKKDVPYVAIALGTGLLSGFADSSFKPNGAITKDGIQTVMNRYKNILLKNPKSFSNLNEFREVATTGTNILTITKYIKFLDPQGKPWGGIEDISGKQYKQLNGTALTAIERVIAVDTSTKNIKGAYKNMFIGKEDEKYAGRGFYDLFIEFTVKPLREITPRQWASGSTPLTYGDAMNFEKSLEFGYKTTSKTNGDQGVPGQFLKTGKENRFWGSNGVDSEKGSHPSSGTISISTDDGSQAAYRLPNQ